MTEQELNLLEISAALSAELGASSAEVMSPKALDTDLLGGLLDHRPDRPVAQAASYLAAFADAPQQQSLFDPSQYTGRLRGVTR